MGKNKKERKEGEEKSEHSAATVCVSGLPYSFTNAQVPAFSLSIHCLDSPENDSFLLLESGDTLLIRVCIGEL